MSSIPPSSNNAYCTLLPFAAKVGRLKCALLRLHTCIRSFVEDESCSPNKAHCTLLASEPNKSGVKCALLPALQIKFTHTVVAALHVH